MNTYSPTSGSFTAPQTHMLKPFYIPRSLQPGFLFPSWTRHMRIPHRASCFGAVRSRTCSRPSSGPIHTGRGAPCNRRKQIMGHTAVNGSVHRLQVTSKYLHTNVLTRPVWTGPEDADEEKENKTGVPAFACPRPKRRSLDTKRTQFENSFVLQTLQWLIFTDKFWQTLHIGAWEKETQFIQ